MRLATWNCNGALRRKLSEADALEADILVVQECENPAQFSGDYRDWAADYAWIGYGKSKGIGVFPRKGQSIEALNWESDGFELFLPVRIGGDIEVIAVWTQNASPSSTAYIGQFWHYLQLNCEKFGPRTLIAGDLNSNAIWDKPRRVWNHSTCITTLEAAGFLSLYHLATGEAQGTESQSTFFLHRSALKPYHIDYVFANKAILGESSPVVSVGRYQDWIGCSDHMPIIVDFELSHNL